MEELQDAIEDAQYMNAVHDDNPRPTKEWKTLSSEKIASFIEDSRRDKSHLFKADTFCSTPMGFYFVRIVS